MEEPFDIGRVLEPNEEKVILAAAAANKSPLISPFLMTLAWTGMRIEGASFAHDDRQVELHRAVNLFLLPSRDIGADGFRHTLNRLGLQAGSSFICSRP